MPGDSVEGGPDGRTVAGVLASRFWDIASKLTVVATVALCTVVVSTQLTLGEVKADLANNGRRDAEHDSRCSVDRAEVAELAARVGEMPAWLRVSLVEKIDGLVERMAEVQATLRGFEARLVRIEQGTDAHHTPPSK